MDVEFTQVLQDMIGDLTGAPEPIQIKLFSEDADLLSQWAPQVADAIGKIEIGKKKPVVDVANGIDNTISGPAVMFQVNPADGGAGRFHGRGSHHRCGGDPGRRTRSHSRRRQRPALHLARPFPRGRTALRSTP